MAVRRDKPGPPAGKDFDPEHYYNLWRYVTRFIRYSDLGQPLVAVGGATGTSSTGTLTLAVASSSGGGGFGTIVAVGDVLGTSTTGTLTSQVGTIAGPFRVGTGGTTVLIDPTEVNGLIVNIISTSANGPNIVMRGTGAAPKKNLRSRDGNFEIINNAYTQTLFSVSDAGTSTALAAFGAPFSQWGTTSAGFVSAGTGTHALHLVGTSSISFLSGVNANFSGTGTAAGWLVTGTGTAAAAQFGTASGQFARWGTSSQTLVQGGAESITGTGTYGGVLSTRALSGAVGSSGSQSNAVISPYLNATPVSITTVVGTLMGYGLPANAITGSGQGVEFSMWGTAQLSPANGGLIVKLGTATLINGTSTIAPSAWVVEGQVVGQASGQQQFFTRFAVFTNNGVGVAQVNVGTLGMNLSTVTTLHMAGTGTNSNARQQNGMTVKFMGLQ